MMVDTLGHITVSVERWSTQWRQETIKGQPKVIFNDVMWQKIEALTAVEDSETGKISLSCGIWKMPRRDDLLYALKDLKRK